MTLTTSGSRSTAARPRTRPATTSRPARPGENHPAAGGAPAPEPSASSPARPSSANRMICCSASGRPPTAPSSAGPRATAGRPPTCTPQLLAAEPHATAERKRELRTEAVKKARQSPLFFDLTISLSKSISIFHASLGENARLARQAGDKDGDAYWSALVAEVDEMIWQAVHAGFGYFQREAGYTRTGSHNTRVHGRETGQWHEADLAVAHWLQHTSRDGDMQLHVHSQIAHTAKTGTDGKWRAPDSLGYNEHIGAVAAIVSQHLEEALTARFGLEWTARDDGHGFEIKGISGEMMRVFSSPPRVDHRRPARPRGAVRAALRPRAVPARARAARAGVELQDARGEGGCAGFRATSRGLGGQARAHPRREPGVGRAIGVARRRTRNRARRNLTRPRSDRGRAGPRGAEGARAGPAGQVRVDARRRDQAPGPGPAPHRHEPGRSCRDAGGPGRPGPSLGVRAGRLPGGARAGGGSAKLAARRRPQRLPAARRHPLRHPRAAGHGAAHARASPRGHRAATGARAGRARARRRPGATRERAHRRPARARASSSRRPGCARTRPPPRSRPWPTAGSCR